MVEPPVKTCTRCGHLYRRLSNGYCNSCKRELATERKEALSAQDRAYFTAQQGSRCDICGLVSSLENDHAHGSSIFRGLICGKCNKGLGLFGDSVERLLSAVLYLLERDASPDLETAAELADMLEKLGFELPFTDFYKGP